jgi:hypothetical protein
MPSLFAFSSTDFPLDCPRLKELRDGPRNFVKALDEPQIQIQVNDVELNNHMIALSAITTLRKLNNLTVVPPFTS